MDMSTQVGIWEKAVHFVKDGWSNLVSGLGSARDKRKFTKNALGKVLSDEELESIFVDDGLGTRIITEMPNDMFREGWEFTFPDMDEKKAKELFEVYKAVFEEIKVVEKVKLAFYWARLYGGAVILIGALDGRGFEFPLNPKKIRYFDSLRVIQATEIKFDDIQFQLNPEKPRFGLPEYYPISFDTPNGDSETRLVHHSRIIELHGCKVPSKTKIHLTKQQKYWGMSELQKVYDHLSTMGESLGSVSAILREFSIGKFKFTNLADILAMPNGEELMKKRVEFMDLTRSTFHSTYMDKDDDFVRENVTFSGIPEVLYIFMMMVASCSGYPITRLFGVSPAGMNSTGESDMRNYYDRVRSDQGFSLEPILLRLVKIISEWQKKEEPYIEFRPLQQLTDKEKSELEKLDAEKEKTKADTWKVYIDAGILEPYQAAYLQFGDDLEKIPIPPDLELPPVETLPEEGANENSEAANAEGENANTEGGSSNEEGQKKNKEGEKSNADPKKRIAELEAKKELTDEEQKELDELKKQAKQKNTAGGK